MDSGCGWFGFRGFNALLRIMWGAKILGSRTRVFELFAGGLGS